MSDARVNATVQATVHASAVLVGNKAVLIQGPSGSGKSALVAALLEAASDGRLPFARLVGDDRLHLEARNGMLLARPAPALEGLLEVRHLGIRKLPFEPVAAIGLVVRLDDPEAERLPETASITLEGVELPLLRVPEGAPALPLVLAWLGTRPQGN